MNKEIKYFWVANPTNSLRINFHDYRYRFSIEKVLIKHMQELF